MTPPDKITVTQAWLYEHDEFGRQVHSSRWGMANGGSFDDFVGWRETQLVCRRADGKTYAEVGPTYQRKEWKNG